ncbi:ABC transporter permease [Clostridium oryzae]|uniref:Bacitracin export permease protein BceB n=1 Tax=Clostridium oryzae TaxID=1450648 RepID=A0A1V4ICQ5_9CLOT|nr:ABC transporter permease [Clostridium oryzae]OPJ57726.1 bacitracin export permease protein BceB [Clostridium oryzae]
MTLVNMALCNIKSKFKNYWTFFLSSTFSVFVLYIFLSIINNDRVKSELGGKKTFTMLFIVASCVIATFSAFFIWYANSFMIKSRKKEFALYMILGMSKKQAAWLAFIENLITIAAAFCAGIVLGLVFNKFFIMLLYQMIGVTGDVQFQFSIKALRACVYIFGCMFAVISVHSTMLIYGNNLIDLFNASSKGEKSLNVSYKTVLVEIISIVFLASGYFLAVQKLAINILLAPLVVTLVVVGTVLFFYETTSLIIYFSKRDEKNFFKGTKPITVCQLGYRYRGNAGTLSVIAVTTTIALCAVITCFGLINKVALNARSVRPFSVEYVNSDQNAATDKVFYSVLKQHEEISIRYKDNIKFIRLKTSNRFSDTKNNAIFILNQSKFNLINKHEGISRRVKLKSDEDCYFVQLANLAADKSVIGKTIKLNNRNLKYNFKVIGTDNKYFIALDHFTQTLIVKDSVYQSINNSINSKSKISITGYILKNDLLSKSFISDLTDKLPKENSLETFLENYSNGLKMVGMMAFIGVFIGIVFLTATGSIIYFKMVMEAQEDREKFIILKKIGLSSTEIKKAISKELIFLFGMPFVVAACNTYIASITLSKIMNVKIYVSFIICILVYAALYSIYYLITLNSYMKTTSEVN